MGRVRLLTALTISSALVLLAGSAQAGFFNRPDVLDVNDSSYYADTGPSSAFVRAFMYADDDWASVWGSMSASARDTSFRVVLFTYLWQPDTAMRNHRRARANQKRYMYLDITIRTVPYNGFAERNSIYVAEKCKGAMTAEDRDNDGDFDLSPAGDDRIRGRLRCHRDILDDLGFSSTAIEILQGIIGNRTRLNISLP